MSVTPLRKGKGGDPLQVTYAVVGRLDIAGNFIPDVAPKPKPKRIVGTPHELQPIPWGTRDEELAKVVLRHMQEANPPITVRWNPFTSPRLARYLHQCGIHF